jgi:hypothetical protein
VSVKRLRIVALADLHGHLPVVPSCDLLIVAGDLCAADGHDPGKQERWLGDTFSAWLAATPARHRVGVAGNHDLLAEQRPDLLAALPWAYLCDSGITVDGVSVWGSPWQTPWDDLAFNLPEPALSARWDEIPAARRSSSPTRRPTVSATARARSRSDPRRCGDGSPTSHLPSTSRPRPRGARRLSPRRVPPGQRRRDGRGVPSHPSAHAGRSRRRARRRRAACAA